MIGILFWVSLGIIVYTYAGYPLLVAVFAQLRPKPKLDRPLVPTVTLLIAAYNEELVIAEKLKNALSLDYPRERLQILVAADGSDDGTLEIVESFADKGVELSYSPERCGKMAAINRAMTKVRGEITVYSDANNIYANEALLELTRPFADKTVAAVSGAKTIMRGDGELGDSEGLYWKYESFIKKQETRLGCCTGVAGEILAIRSVLFSAAPNDVINDDFHMAMDLIGKGYRIVYAPEAKSFERVSPSAQDEIIRRSRIIAGRYQAIARAYQYLPYNRPLLVWQIVSHKFLRPLVPFAMMGALLANLAALIWPGIENHPLLYMAFPYNWIMLVLQLSFYGMAWAGHSRTYGRTLGRLVYLPTFLFNSNLAAVIGLYRYLARRQTSIWKMTRRRGDDEDNLSPGKTGKGIRAARDRSGG